MNLDNQIKLLDRIHQYSMLIEDNKINYLNLDSYSMQIVKNPYSLQTSFRLRDISDGYALRTVIIICYNPTQQNELLFDTINDRLLTLSNITSIIRDYKELDINQFILIYSRSIFNLDGYPLEVVLKLLENSNELE